MKHLVEYEREVDKDKLTAVTSVLKLSILRPGSWVFFSVALATALLSVAFSLKY